MEQSHLRLVPVKPEKPEKPFKSPIKQEYWQQILDLDTFGNTTEFIVEWCLCAPRGQVVRPQDVKKLVSHLRKVQFEELQAEVKAGFNFTMIEFKKLFRDLKKMRLTAMKEEDKKMVLAFIDREIKMYGIEFSIYSGDATATIQTGANKTKFIEEMKSLLNIKK